mgnify:CR=1 FL=1
MKNHPNTTNNMKFFSESVFSLSVAALAVLAACDDDRPSDKTGQRVPLQLNVSKPDGTRLDGTQWEEGDQIGIYLYNQATGLVDGAANVCYSVSTDGSCSPASTADILWLENGQTYTLLAYYPYSSELSESLAGYAVGDWNVQEERASLDVLYDSVMNVTASSPSVTIAFERQCALLELRFTADDVDLQAISVSISGKNYPMVFDVTTGGWSTVQSADNLVEGEPIVMPVTVDDGGTTATATAILPPSSVYEPERPVLSMTLSDTDVRTYTFPEDFTFEAGKLYRLNISLSPGLDIDAIVEQILNMTESGTIEVSGYACDPDAAIERIKEALGTLATNRQDVFVTLDMSGVLGMTSIGESAFDGCSALAGITIPSGVTSIGNYAFEGCTGLTSIEIPSIVTSIGEGAFLSCSGLTSIVVASGNSVYEIGRAHV